MNVAYVRALIMRECNVRPISRREAARKVEIVADAIQGLNIVMDFIEEEDSLTEIWKELRRTRRRFALELERAVSACCAPIRRGGV
jgi:hypothetical protein